jgi:hypothetical protein
MNAQRARFAENQVLRAAQLEAEQTYLVDARRRHVHVLAGPQDEPIVCSPHTSGIVCGLELSLDEGGVTVTPGIAIDDAGRELILTQKSPLEHADGEATLAYRELEGDARSSEFPELSVDGAGVTLGKVSDGQPVEGGRTYVGALGAAVMPPLPGARLSLDDSARVLGLAVDAGATSVDGSARVAGRLTAGSVRLLDSAAPAAPGSVQRCGDELRITLPAPASSQQAVSCYVGELRVLSVLSVGAVAVSGDVRVEGKLVPGPLPADISLPAVGNAIVDGWTQGLSSAVAGLERQYGGKLELSDLALKRTAGRVDVAVTVRNGGAADVKKVKVTAYGLAHGSPPKMRDRRLKELKLAAAVSVRAGGYLRLPGNGSVDVLVRAEGTLASGVKIDPVELSGSV